MQAKSDDEGGAQAGMHNTANYFYSDSLEANREQSSTNYCKTSYLIFAFYACTMWLYLICSKLISILTGSRRVNGVRKEEEQFIEIRNGGTRCAAKRRNKAQSTGLISGKSFLNSRTPRITEWTESSGIASVFLRSMQETALTVLSCALSFAVGALEWASKTGRRVASKW